MACNTLVFFVNGRKIEESCADPAMTLLQYLRLKLKLTGTKLGCAEGGCGACTVMVSKYNRINSKIMHFSVNACLAPICSMHGLAVTTVEGIGSTKTGLHPVQERLARSHGSQCGFCTPGIVMSMYSLLRNNPQPSRSELESAFEGNLCRCTGYRPILDGFNTFTKEYQCGLGEKCCKFQKQSDSDEMGAALFDASEFTQYDPTQEPIFPSELQLDAKYDEQSLVFKTDRFTWYRPTTLSEVLDLKATFPHARLIVGNTEVGVEVKFKNQYYPVLVDVSHIPELTDIKHTEAGVRFGASCTLSNMEHELASAVEREPEHKTRVFRAILEMLRWFAGHQIRNVASAAGNIMTASPISDLNPLFLAAGCKLIAISKGTASNSITMDEKFFKGYRKTSLKPEEVLVSILIPFTKKNEFFAGYKQAHRRDDDIAIVNAGMKITLDESNLIQNAAFAFGGMAPFTVMALKTMKGVIGRAWSENLVDEVCKLLESDLPLPPGTPGGMEPYRRTLTTSFFFKFFLHVQQEINNEKIPKTYNSATTQYKREASRGVQLYEEVAPGQLDKDPVGRPLKHVSAEKQVTGEAIYCDDIPKYEGELYLALVLSTKAHAKIISVDTSAAVAIPGVHCYVDHNDIPASGTNFTRVTALKDEEVFATEKVTCQGHIIGAIVADNQAAAQRAAKLVRVEYEELRPILTIEEAIAADSFFTKAQELADGNADVGLQQAAHYIEGEVRVGGQEHFYLETQTTIGVPKGEDGEIEIFCSCQSPTTAQMLIASVLGVPANRVVVRVKRMGGGFGGKETRFNTLLLPVVVAAHKLGRPVRCMLDRDEDMILTGTRHPFLARYKAGCNADGKLTAVEMQLYNNGGNTLDLSDAVMGKAILSLNNAYSIPNVKGVGRTCKTNIPSNTAFRGFGGPQAMFVMETIMTQLAAKLNTDVTKLREINLVQEGDRLYYNMIVKNCTMQKCWNQVIESGQLNHRKKEIVEFNNQNRWKKRGIAVVPTKFGIAFTQPVLNQIEESCADPAMTLLQYLRLKLKLTGTKLGCAEGGCGACTVMVSKYNRINSKIMHFSVNACLAPICSMHGLAVTTVEGIGSTKTGLHPVQERLARSHGSQCGFCTPGIVMSMYSLLRNNPQPSRSELESAFEGNLCRCTGYRPILDGFNTFTKEYQCGLGEKCCKFQKQSDSDEMGAALFDASEFTQYDPTQEPIFPSELQLDAKYDEQSLVFKTDRFTWYRPTTLSEVLDLKATFPHARLIVGNTEVGVEVKFKNQYYPVLVDVSHIPELTDIKHTEAGVRFGASCTLSNMEHELASAVEREPEHKTRVFRAILEMLRWFAGHQIRNVASVAGNIMTASPISDLNPLFLAAGCKLIAISKGTASNSITMDEKFFKGYRKTSLKPEEVLVSILIPFTKKNEFFAGYKQAHRRDDDIAIVNAGMKITLDESNLIQNAAFAFGGMAPFTVMALKTMKGVIGRAWSENLVDEVCKLLESDLPLPPGTPGGMEPYRRTLTTSFFFKFFLHVQQEINNEKIPKTYNSATTQYKREASRGVQLYEEVAPGQLDKDPVGRPLKHVSAEKQVTGETIYCDDIPKYEGELYLALVLSTKAHAKIISVDTSAAVAIPGVHCYVDHNDIPASGTNFTRVTALKDEEVFATEKVTCQGHIIGAIVADNQAAAQRAAKLVRVEYEELRPILTIEEAIAADSFFTKAQELADGNADVGLQQAAHYIEGEVRVGGQEHFYLETQTTIGVPKGEDGEIEIFCSCQSPTTAQMLIASVLGVPANRVVVRVKRMGGGFGGKETRFNTLLLPVVVAAHKLGRPVRCMLDRDEDMILTGTRHPFLARYKAGCNADGKLTAVEMQLYNNGGNTLDLSDAVMGKAILSLNNAYSIPNVKGVGRTCKTNIPSNTAFRGFGGPQAMFVMETIMTQLAAKLNTDVTKLREINLVQEGDRLYYNMIVKNCTMQKCWNQVIESGQLNHRKKEIVEFNNQNRWKKRGIAVVPTKFGIAFTQPVLNQTGALVHIYTDGSVLLTHGGTEMGQGLHTKMLQVASRALRIDINKIHFSETSTATVPNTSATAASVGSDLNGMAVLEACKKLLKRLDPYIRENPKGKWEDWVAAAYVDRVSLSATGFYKIPDVGFNMEKKEGRPFNYFSFGAGISEVEVDCLTGDHTVLRTDIVMDVGTSLNPAIDIGQIEGGFVQGYGLFTLEEQRYSPDGFLYTRGPGMYKIPGFTDIPVEFNVSILKGASNPQAVYSSKAIGEPPLFIASSVFFAIYDAVSAARKEEGLMGHFRFDSPATAEKIRMACVDKFTKQFPEADPGTYKPWFVYL